MESSIARTARRLSVLRFEAPADHHRYLLGLIMLFWTDVELGRAGDYDHYLMQYREEFDL